MRALGLPPLTLALLLAARSSGAGPTPLCEPSSDVTVPPFAPKWFARTLVGSGAAWQTPLDDRGPDLAETAEFGAYPLGGALAAGVSLSNASDLKNLWAVTTPGIFAKIDLTYWFLTGMYSCAPAPRRFPFRVQLGSRIGLGISESFRPLSDVPDVSPFKLLRPELLSFVDAEFPVPPEKHYAIVVRGGVDTSVNLSSLFRWSVSLGLAYAWGADP